MKRQSVLVLVVLLGMVNIASADTHQPWTATETSLFSTTDYHPKNIGSGWFDNNLILNYGVWDGTSGGDGSSETYLLQDFIPTDAIGISFGVSSDTQLARIHVWAQKFSVADEFLFQHGVITLQNNMDFSANINSLFSSGPDAVSPIDYSYDIPESTLNNITTINFIFTQDMVDAPVSKFRFAADGRGMAGTTTFSDVGWIIFDGDSSPLPSPFAPNPCLVPVPSAVILGSLGLTFSGWLLKRKRMV
ncbi:MAG: hypothetical protein GY774_14475 [Planctomycetes bacterium]|nr:hypothetical protein [Planctomycetota bacterium]